MDESRRWVEFGHYLVEQRERLGLKRRDAAKRAKMTDAAWRELEIGRKESFGGIKLLPNPSVDTLKRVADAIEVPYEELLEHVGWKPVPSLTPGDLETVSKSNATLIQKIARLESRDRAVVEKLIDTLLDTP